VSDEALAHEDGEEEEQIDVAEQEQREPSALVLGPLGIVTWFPAKFRMRVLEPITFDEPPDQPRYSRSRIMDSAEMIRQRIQEALYDMLRQRQSVWRG